MLSRIDDPTLREELYIRKLDRLADEIRSEISYTLQPLRQLKLVMKHIYEQHGYTPAKQEYYKPHLCPSAPGSGWQVRYSADPGIHCPFYGSSAGVTVERSQYAGTFFLMRYDFDTQVVFLDPFNSGETVTMNDCPELPETPQHPA